jgi:hypothetical protein
MSRLVIKYRDEDSQKSSWGCVASGCTFLRQGNAQLERALKHATTCKILQADHVELWRQAIQESGDNSLGARLKKDLAAEDIPMEVEPPMKRLRAQNTLNMADLRETGKRVKEEACQLFQDKVDHVIMCLICVRGLVPHVIESPEWKELMGLLSDSYHPTSATTFADKHIPREAVYVREKQIKALRMINNLTLTFDGNTTRKPHSVYTVHATTPSRETYFLDAHEASDERHTTQWVTDKLLKVR